MVYYIPNKHLLNTLLFSEELEKFPVLLALLFFTLRSMKGRAPQLWVIYYIVFLVCDATFLQRCLAFEDDDSATDASQTKYGFDDEQNRATFLPNCSQLSTKPLRPRIAVISHDSSLATFLHNPEQGARDAAAIMDINVEWNRHLINTGSKMTMDIKSAVDNVRGCCTRIYKIRCTHVDRYLYNGFMQGVDGIILTIPNDEVYEGAQYALDHNIPVLVFNTGLDYARKLGLTRILQDDHEAGTMLGRELRSRGYSKPLVIQLTALDNKAFATRLESFTNAVQSRPTLLELQEYNNTAQPMIKVRDTFLTNGTFDSIVSLGGSVRTNLSNNGDRYSC